MMLNFSVGCREHKLVMFEVKFEITTAFFPLHFTLYTKTRNCIINFSGLILVSTYS